jgi:hypothetical protein
MRIRRAIIPAILSLGAAGAILVGSAAPTAAAQAPAAHAVVVASTAHSAVYYHW